MVRIGRVRENRGRAQAHKLIQAKEGEWRGAPPAAWMLKDGAKEAGGSCRVWRDGRGLARNAMGWW